MSFALRMRGVADKLLNKFDERDVKIKLLRASEPVYNSTSGEYEFPEDIEIELTGVVTPFDSSMIDGTTIQSGDAKLIITSEHQPKHPDKILLDGVQWSIVKPNPVNYTGDDLTIAYFVQIRK